MALAEQPSSESRLLSRLTREHGTPSSRVLSRLERHSQPGILSRSSARPQHRAAARRSAGYSPQQGSGMLDRLVGRAGLRPAPNNFGLALSSLGTDFVVASPPWLARAEQVPAGESPVRRRRAARPSAPVIDGWGAVQGVPGSSPVARSRAGALSRASGISPPSLEAPLYPSTFPSRNAQPEMGLGRSAGSPVRAFEPSSPAPQRPRSSFAGRPLSRTVAAIQASPGLSADSASNSHSSYAKSVRAPRELGSSRNLGRGFSVARSAARRASGADLIFPTAAPTTRASQDFIAAGEVPAVPVAAVLSRQSSDGAAQAPSPSSSVPTPARPSSSDPTATPLARAAARSTASPESGSSKRHGAGAARRATTLASASLALTEAMPAPAHFNADPQGVSSARPLTHQTTSASSELSAHRSSTPSVASAIAAGPFQPPSPTARRTAPTAVTRAFRHPSRPSAGALAHVAARAASVESSSPTSARGPLARSFGRSLPAPPSRQATQSHSFELTSPTAPSIESASKAPALARKTSTISGEATPVGLPGWGGARTATRAEAASPSSKALARLSVSSTVPSPTSAPLSGSLTAPLAGSPVARTLARYGSADSTRPGGISRTRSLTASAELGMSAPLRRDLASPAPENVLAAPAPPSSTTSAAVNEAISSPRRPALSGTALAASPAARAASPAARAASPAARAASPATHAASPATRAASPADRTPGRPVTSGSTPAVSRSSSRSPVARAFARAGQSAPASSGGSTTSASPPQVTGQRTLTTSFEAALPAPSSPLSRSAEMEATGPGRGFTQARRVRRERSASSFGPTGPSLTVGLAAPAAMTTREPADLARQSETGIQPITHREAPRSAPPGARLVARGATPRWTTSEAPLALPTRQQAEASPHAPRSSTGASGATSPSVRRSRHQVDSPGLSSLAAPQSSAPTAAASTTRRMAVPALSRLVQQDQARLSAGAPTASGTNTLTTAAPSTSGVRARTVSRPDASARRRYASASSETQQLLNRVADLKPGESINAAPADTLANAGAMLTQAARRFDARGGRQPRESGRVGGAPDSRKTARREGFATRTNSLVDASQLENLVRKELTTLSAPRPAMNEAEIVRMAREVLAGEGKKSVARKEKGGAVAGGEQQKDLDDLLHRLIRRMLIDEQIGGERTLTP